MSVDIEVGDRVQVTRVDLGEDAPLIDSIGVVTKIDPDGYERTGPIVFLELEEPVPYHYEGDDEETLIRRIWSPVKYVRLLREECPKCEQNLMARDDYLCQECRNG